MKTCSAVIGGDVYPGHFENVFVHGEVASVFGDLWDEVHFADLTVVNLECPLTNRGEPIRKLGPHFRAGPGAARGLKVAGINAVTLANNHIRDYGEDGVEQTIEVLGDVGIRSFGAGKGADKAAEPAVFELNGIRVGFLGMAEHEFSIAGSDSWGANPIDLIRFTTVMEKLRSSAEPLDHLIILLHAGNEYFPYPNPWQQRLSRFFVDQGATAVINQHSHVAGTYEKYNGGFIVYGQGDFIFGSPGSLRPARKDGFLVKLELGSAGSVLGHRIIPFTRHEAGVRKMNAHEESAFGRAIEARNKVLASAELLEEQWREFVNSRRHGLLSGLQGQPRLLRGIIRKLGLEQWWYTRYDPRPPLNYIQCESHRQVLTALLESMLNSRN